MVNDEYVFFFWLLCLPFFLILISQGFPAPYRLWVLNSHIKNEGQRAWKPWGSDACGSFLSGVHLSLGYLAGQKTNITQATWQSVRVDCSCLSHQSWKSVLLHSGHRESFFRTCPKRHMDLNLISNIILIGVSILQWPPIFSLKNWTWILGTW